MHKLFEEKGIKLIAPDFANSNLDIPSIQFDVEQLAMSEDCLIIDVGGDDAGATALGRYAEAMLERFADQIDMLYVINQRRYLTHTPDEAVALMYEIEAASRMKHTAIVNNTNLGCETTLEVVEESLRLQRRGRGKDRTSAKVYRLSRKLCELSTVRTYSP